MPFFDKINYIFIMTYCIAFAVFLYSFVELFNIPYGLYSSATIKEVFVIGFLGVLAGVLACFVIRDYILIQIVFSQVVCLFVMYVAPSVSERLFNGWFTVDGWLMGSMLILSCNGFAGLVIGGGLYRSYDILKNLRKKAA